MKFIITENKFNKIIYEYLTEFYEPDYGWELFEFYEKEIDNFMMIEFFVNDINKFTFIDAKWNKKVLNIDTSLFINLTETFGKHWILVFKQWFEDNTGLTVKEINFESL